MASFNIGEFNTDRGCVVALGCFDGVHIGHANVISAAVRIATEHSLACVVWSFAESPKNFFLPGSAPSITPADEKRELISSLGADIVVSARFNAEICNLSPEDFFNSVICEKLNARHVVCGFNYTFGRHARGNVALLSSLCEKQGIAISVIEPTVIDGHVVSSSAIRTALNDGDVELAEKYLGRRFSLVACVEHGNALGRTFGFPTVNQYFNDNTVLPRFGVYLTRIHVEGKEFFGITNVGTHPTIMPDKAKAETYIFDFSGNLYGESIKLEFLKFIRPEKKFDSVGELKGAIACDIEKARIFSKNL